MDPWHPDFAPLGKALSDARHLRRLTQAQLGALAGVRPQRIVRLEKAQAKMTALELIDLARALGDALVLPAPNDTPAPTEKKPPGFYNLENLFR